MQGGGVFYGRSLKLQQYKVGQAFVDAVVEQESLEFLNMVWEKAANMPSMDEVNNPSMWIGRMKGIIKTFPV